MIKFIAFLIPCLAILVLFCYGIGKAFSDELPALGHWNPAWVDCTELHGKGLAYMYVNDKYYSMKIDCP